VVPGGGVLVVADRHARANRRAGQVLQSGGATIPSIIALRFGESGGLGLSVLMAAGLTLFALTLAVNLGAGMIVSRSRSGAGVEI